MLSNATNQPKSAVEFGYMFTRGLLGPPVVKLLIIVNNKYYIFARHVLDKTNINTLVQFCKHICIHMVVSVYGSRWR